jgi:multidrug efflux system outer membrane protein
VIRFSFVAASLLLISCVVGPEYQPPTTKIPDHWSADRGAPSSPAATQSFWASFEDPILSRLIQQAIENNYDLKIAGERIRAAHATVRAVAAGALPQLGVGAAVENRRQTQTLDWPPPATNFGEYPYYALGFNASWELDLFGQTQHRKESARAAADAAVEIRRDILISLTAAVASNYLSFRATELRLQIAQDNLNTARRTRDIAHRAFASGERSHLDVSEADGRVHGIEAGIPALRAHSEDLAHALAILLAQAPAQFATSELHGSAMLPAPPLLPPSLPSEVITLRPDVRRAEREYAQSTANLGVATADLYPHFSIPLSLGPTASQVHDLFEHASLLWRAGVDGTQNLYSGGRLRANVGVARANEEAALLSYRKTVLNAFGEVEDALSNQWAEELRYRALTAQLADVRQALLEAQKRYRAGQVGLLPVLEDQQLVYSTQDAQVSSVLARCLAEISLFKALGGRWQEVVF